MLIRALAPTHGLAFMRRRRGVTDERLLCSGPGRLCEALGITDAHNGLALDAPPFALRARPAKVEIAIGPRIGITKAVDKPVALRPCRLAVPQQAARAEALMIRHDEFNDTPR